MFILQWTQIQIENAYVEKLISKTKRKKNWNDDTVLTSAKFILMAYNGFRLARSSAAFISEKKTKTKTC